MQTSSQLTQIAKNISEALAITVFLIGVLVLIGWQFNIEILKSVSRDFVTMKSNTALSLVFLGISLWSLQEKRAQSRTSYIGWVSAVAAMFVGGITILEYIIKVNLGIDKFLFQESSSAFLTIYPGRMALNTAFSFVFLGVSLLYLNIKTKRGLYLSIVPAILVMLAATLVIIGYFFDVSEFYLGNISYTPMALHTAISFFLISFGILFAHPEGNLTRVFVSSSLAGSTVRRLLPMAFVVPVIFGLLEELSDHYDFFSVDFGRSVTAFVSIIVLAALIWLNAILMEKKEEARSRAEEKLEKEKQISQSLSKDLEKFKLAADTVADHVIITDANGIILYANKAVEIITGYKIEEVVGKKAGQVWGGHMSKKFYENLWHKIKKEKKLFVGELTNYKKDGTPYIAEVRISPILYDGGVVHFFVGIERDVTKIRELDKMRAEFISLASHQLRTPLTAIKWYVEILLKTKREHQEDGYLRQVYASNERMIKLVNDLLDVSHIESGKKFSVILKIVDLVPVVKDVVEMISVSLRSRQNKGEINLDSGFPKELKLDIDEIKIRQVFQNLIDNAVNYSLDKFKIIVGYKQEGDMAIFYVKDHGLGIPKNQQSRVFEKFFRADNTTAVNTTGTGLGLYIAKAIVERHGGKIWFESEERVGTTFYFSLPLNRDMLLASKE
ncbi:MAG: PAS domain-containing sensor histidine kinase [Candidatus Magasanikbacteria bacterium]|nr:PAS domain-containing sensor histidine kinase [Candidatus Magasanikbacteria bacterium]